MKRILLSLVFFFSSIVSTQNLFGQRVGINTNAPSTVFHINKGTATGDNPLRAEGFLSFQANDSTVLVVDPVDGTIRYMSFLDLSNQITLDTNQVMGIVLTKADTLFNNNAFVDSIISVMVQNGDTLLSNPNFTDSIFTLVRDSLLIDINFNTSTYTYIKDSLLLDTAWLSALGDSIDNQNLDSMTLNQTLLGTYIENGLGASVDLLPLASDSTFYRAIRDSLLGDSVFLSSIDSLLLSDSSFINGVIDSLLTNVYFKDSIFTYTRDSLIYDQAFIDSMFTSIRDSIIFDSEFFDSIYSLASDSLLLDSAWLAALNDSIDDQNLDSMTLNSTILTTYIEDGTSASQDLLPLASDSSFYSTIRDSLLGDSVFTSSVDSILRADTNFMNGIVDSLLTNVYFKDSIFTYTRDSLIYDQAFIDSMFTSIRDSIIFDSEFFDSIYSLASDSLLLDSAWLAALNDSIDDQNLDSMTLNSTILTTYIEDGTSASQDLLPLASDSSFYSTIRDSLLGDSVFASSVDSILRADTNFMNGIVDSLLTNVYFKDSLFTYTRDSLIYDQAFIDSMFTSIRDSIIFDSEFFDSIYSLASDSLLLDSAWLAALNDSIDDQNLDSMVLNGTTLTTYIEDGTAANEDLLPLASDSSFVSTIASDSNFVNTLTSDSLFISNLSSDSSFVDSLLGNNYFTDSIYTLNRDSLLLDTNFLNAVADSIDSDVDSAILVGDDTINIYEDGKIIPVDISALKDSAEWVSGAALGLNANNIYARKAFGFGDTVVIRGFGGQNGYLGLGIPSPTRRLHVGGGAIFTSNSGTNVRFQNNAGTRYAEFLINSGTLELDGGGGSFNINRFTNANLVMNDGGGRVSIGRKSGIPGRLTVFGFTADATDYALVVADSNNAPVNHLLSVRNDGNVGIQTSTPTQALDVNGQARIRTINDTNDVAGVLTANAQGVIQNMPYDTLLAKINDSSEWVDGSLVGLTAGNIYARKALAKGDTIVLDTAGRFAIGTNTPDGVLHVQEGNIVTDHSFQKVGHLFKRGGNDIGLIYTATNKLAFQTMNNNGFGFYDSSASEIAILDSNGFLALASNSAPTQALDVNGQARIRTINDTNDVAGVLTANAQGVIQNMPYDTLLAKINDSSEWVDGSLVGLTAGSIYARKALAKGDTVVIDTSGKLGIGTNNPMRDLHISNSAPTLTLENSSNTNTINMRVLADGSSLIRFKDESSKGRNYDIGTGTLFTDTGSLVIRDVTSSSRRFVIDSTGFIGIGNIIPTKKIDVDGEARIRTINDTNDVAGVLTANAQGVIQNMPYDTLLAKINDSSEWVDGSLVGLTAGNIYARKALAKGDTVVIDTNGKIGIGLDNPTQNLEVSGTGTVVSHVVTTDTSILDRAVFGLKRGTKLWDLGVNSNFTDTNDLLIREGATVVATFQEGGNFGLGILDPTHKLDVNGETRIRTINDTNDVAGVLTANAQGVIQNMPYDTLLAKINDSSEWVDGSLVGLTAGNIYARKALAKGDTVVIDTSGKLGIGITSPAFRLDVDSTINTYGEYSIGSITALSVTPNGSTSVGNTAVGYYALDSLTTGNQNTAIGFNSMKSTTTGIRNTASGYESMLNNTIGFRNTATGYRSLRSNVDGRDNAAYGSTSLQQNTSGLGNSAFGALSLSSNTTGNNNTAIGLSAQQNSTTASQNTSVGHQSMEFNTTGSNNTGLGWRALRFNDTAHYNTAVGAWSSANNDNGQYNTTLGYRSLYQNVGGSYNIAIGNSSGENLTSGDKNIIIGSDIGFPSTTDSNQLNIGNIIYGTDIDGVSNTISTGNIGIGVQSPTNKLHITATSNPLRIEGVQTGANTDSVLTIDATGVVRKLDFVAPNASSFISITASTAIADGDNTEVVFANSTSAAINITLPDATLNTGERIIIKWTAGGNPVTVSSVSTVDGSSSLVASGDDIEYMSDGTQWWVIRR